jgi:putative tricarboxylic transport membrane protein
MRSYEQIYSFSWILLSIGICAESLRLQIWDASSGPVAGFIPFLAGILIGLSGILMFLSGWSGRVQKGPRERFWPERRATQRILYVLAGLCVLAFLLPILGFLIASIIVTAFMLRVIEPQRWAVVIATSLSCCLLVYWLFHHFLQVSLPKGFLGI